MSANIEWVINRISATQLKQYKMCPRKWYYRYVMGKKSPPTPAMQLGTDIHTDLERFISQELAEPTMTESRYIWQQGIIPPVEKVYAVELDMGEEGITLCDGAISLMGYLDLVWFEAGEGKVYVWDWKTRSRFDYAPTPVQLQEDIQAILYAYGMFVHLDKQGFTTNEIVFAHVNILREDKGGPDHTYVETVMTRKHVETFIKTRIEPQIYDMNETARTAIGLVKPNKSECFTFGRCEHYTPCYEVPWMQGETAVVQTTPAFNIIDLLNPTPKEDTMNTLDQLMAAGNIQPNNGAVAPAQPAPVDNAVAALFGSPQPQPQPTPVANPAPQMPMPGQFAQPTPVANPVPQDRPPLHLSSATQPQPQAPAAPSIQPPDAQPDIQPRSITDMTVQQFSWADTEGIGAKGVEKILAYCAENGITHMTQLMQGFDLKKLPAVGEKTAQALRVRFGQGVPFAPDGQPLASNEFQVPPGQGVQMNQIPTSPPAQVEPTPEEWLRKAADEFDRTGIIPVYVGEFAPEYRQVFDQYVAQKKAAFRPNNPDYAQPAPAPEPVQSDVAGLAEREAQLAADAERAKLVAQQENAQQELADQAQELGLGYGNEPLLGIRSFKLKAVVGEFEAELDLELDPTKDARPYIEAAKAYLNG